MEDILVFSELINNSRTRSKKKGRKKKKKKGKKQENKFSFTRV